MHRLSTAFVLGYHGCDAEVAERLLSGEQFKQSENLFDWLGHGIYFWEANPVRALQFARDEKKRDSSKIEKPAVVGCVIDLGYCLDLTTTAGVEQAKIAHSAFMELLEKSGDPVPSNSGGKDRLKRNLDCAVINTLHEIRDRRDQQPFDSVKGMFVEGREIYDGAAIYEKTHIQICLRRAEQIKGVFRVQPRDLN